MSITLEQLKTMLLLSSTNMLLIEDCILDLNLSHITFKIFINENEFIEYMTERAFHCEMELSSETIADSGGNIKITVLFTQNNNRLQSTINRIHNSFFEKFINILKQYAVENKLISEKWKINDMKWKDYIGSNLTIYGDGLDI